VWRTDRRPLLLYPSPLSRGVNKIYHTVGADPNSNSEIVEVETKIDNLSIHLHGGSLSWLSKAFEKKKKKVAGLSYFYFYVYIECSFRFILLTYLRICCCGKHCHSLWSAFFNSSSVRYLFTPISTIKVPDMLNGVQRETYCMSW
jgi:hypothetical protein